MRFDDGDGWALPYREMILQFETNADIDDFERKIGQQITPQTRTIWYPANGRLPIIDLDRPPRDQLTDLDDRKFPWYHEWQGMPECVNSSIISGQAPLTVNFASEEDVEAFKRAIGQDFNEKTKSIWHPEQKRARFVGRLRYKGVGLQPRYPIFIPSKGRSDTILTCRSLDRINVPYRVVVEPQEYDKYAARFGEEILLTLDANDQGLAYARNWIWARAREEGAARHWQLDDNIKGFYRYNRNQQVPVTDGTGFRVIEDFSDRYENVGQSGMQYFMFVPRKRKYPSFSQNVRIYSCTLNLTSMPLEYRGPYNDDTDMSIKVLKSGYCTILSNAFLADKMATMQMKGGMGYLDEEHDVRLEASELLQKWHPDITSIQWRWGRFQHLVDYRPLRGNRLRLKEGVEVQPGVNNYGMQLQELIDDVWTDVPEDPRYDRPEEESNQQEEMF
jgi:hypothetical protein